MATYGMQPVIKTYIADADLATSQFKFVKAGSIAGQVSANATAGGSCLGVLQNDPRSGEEAKVLVMGYSKVYANAEAAASALTFGGFIKSGSHGAAVGAISATASMFTMGIAQEALATGSGVIIEALILPAYVRA